MVSPSMSRKSATAIILTLIKNGGEGGGRNTAYGGPKPIREEPAELRSRSCSGVEHGSVAVDQLTLPGLHASTALEEVLLERSKFRGQGLLQADPRGTRISHLNAPEFFGIELFAMPLPAPVDALKPRLL